jgi:hypothetical protein
MIPPGARLVNLAMVSKNAAPPFYPTRERSGVTRSLPERGGGMPAINIASYTVSPGLQRPGGTTQHARVTEVRSEALDHGITWRILLAFHTNFGSWSGSPVAGYMNLLDPARPVIAA